MSNQKYIKLSPKVPNRNKNKSAYMELAPRFWRKVRKQKRGCWLWTGAKSGTKYGIIWKQGKIHLAHRISWELRHGSPPTKDVLHKCDVRLCVRPFHLYLGTNVENTRDRHKRGRDAKGIRNGFAKLTDADVLEICKLRKKGVLRSEVATRFGIHPGYVSRIVGGSRK